MPDLQSGGCRFESQLVLFRTKVYSAFHPSGVGKWVPAAAGKAKADMAHSNCGWTCGCAGKTRDWDPLRTGERFCGGDSLQRGAISSVYTFIPFNALILLVGWQEGHLTCIKLGVGLLVITILLELRTSYISSCQHQLHYPFPNKIQNIWRHSGTGLPRFTWKNGI